MIHIDLESIYKYKIQEVQKLKDDGSIKDFRINLATWCIWIFPLDGDMQKIYWYPDMEFTSGFEHEGDL